MQLCRSPRSWVVTTEHRTCVGENKRARTSATERTVSDNQDYFTLPVRHAMRRSYHLMSERLTIGTGLSTAEVYHHLGSQNYLVGLVLILVGKLRHRH